LTHAVPSMHTSRFPQARRTASPAAARQSFGFADSIWIIPLMRSISSTQLQLRYTITSVLKAYVSMRTFCIGVERAGDADDRRPPGTTP